MSEAQIDRKHKRFELMVLLLVALPCVWVLLSSIVSSIQSAKRAALTSQEEKYVRQANVAMFKYTDDHGDRYPDLSKDIRPLLRPYLEDPKVIEAMSRFVWNKKLSGLRLRDIDNHWELWVVKSVAPGTRRIVYSDMNGFPRSVDPMHESEVLGTGEPILRQAQTTNERQLK